MNLRVKRSVRRWGGDLYARLGRREIREPIFIVGCGRSGTTILGRTLDRHPEITVMNELREVWSAAYPITDIGSSHASQRGGRLVLDADHATVDRSRYLRRLFLFEARLKRAKYLVEKLPINAFRMHFLLAIFPDARFIHLHRNGLEVAHSIARFNRDHGWYGADGLKWKALVDFAQSRPETRELADLCRSDVERGLLEWRLSTEAILAHLRNLSAARYRQITYDQLLDHPVATINTLLRFIGVEPHTAVTEYVEANLQRRSPKREREAVSESQMLIGGQLLNES